MEATTWRSASCVDDYVTSCGICETKMKHLVNLGPWVGWSSVLLLDGLRCLAATTPAGGSHEDSGLAPPRIPQMPTAVGRA